MRWLTNFYDFRLKWIAIAGIGIHPTKTWLSQLVNFKDAIWTLEERYAIKFRFKLGKNSMRVKAGFTAMTQRPRDRVPSGSMLALPDPRRPDRANPPTNFDDPFFWQHWHDLHTLGSHWTDSQQGILCWGFKGVQEEIQSEGASTLQFGSEAFSTRQCTSPQLHPCHRCPRWASRQFLTVPIVQTLLLVTFGYSLSSEAVVLRQSRRWKRL